MHGNRQYINYGDDSTFQEFVNEFECCLEADFSYWFHKSLQSVDDLKTEDCDMVLKKLEKTKATNMRLEGELSEVRASVPTINRKPSAERYIYQSYLSFLYKEHLAAGRKDFLKDDPKEMVRSGVPLERNTRQRSSRPDIFDKNSEYWKRVKEQFPDAVDHHNRHKKI